MLGKRDKTFDVVPIVAGQIAARGYTDAERLAAVELVYTGLVRGFVMATANRAISRRLSSLPLFRRSPRAVRFLA